jgi:hypothetical protein
VTIELLKTEAERSVVEKLLLQIGRNVGAH